jgi:hypothetical protein
MFSSTAKRNLQLLESTLLVLTKINFCHYTSLSLSLSFLLGWVVVVNQMPVCLPAMANHLPTDTHAAAAAADDDDAFVVKSK